MGRSTISSRCSGARRLEIWMACKMESARMIFPCPSKEAWAISFRGSWESWVSSSFCTASAKLLLVVMRTALASLSCSAWLSISAATWAGLLFSSAMMRISLGPAIMSMATCPKTCRLASAT